MKNIRFFVLVAILVVLPTLSACSKSVEPEETTAPDASSWQIYLYGEQHGVEEILEKEFELWNKYYHEEDMRHLFIEAAYYTAEFLNLWMKSDNDDILNEVYREWDGTASHNTAVREFYRKIKSDCPETIFHGTDVGHQYYSTGKRFLRYLDENDLKDSEQYLLAQEAVEQGRYYYVRDDHVYRENTMAENFIRELDSLDGENVMGIYGGAHTGLDAMDYMTNSVPCMANQLKAHYGDAVYSEDLSLIAKDIEPYRVDIITIDEKDYEASYFGIQDLTGFKDYASREFWRLENAYDNFKDKKKTGDVLPYDNYPMLIEVGQVFAIDYTKTDGSVQRLYYRSDGHVWDGLPSTEEFTVK